MTRSALAALTLTVALSATGARAQTNGAGARRTSLFFATATLGLGDCGHGLCRDDARTGPSFGLGGGFFVRPIPYLAVGLELRYVSIAADDVHADRNAEAARYFLADIALRGVLPLGIVEPWAGVAFGYGYFGYFWQKDKKDEDVTVDGTNVELGLGVDVRVADRVSIGATFRFALPDWANQCRSKIEVDRIDTRCTDVDLLDPEDRDALPDQLWYLGLVGRFDIH